MINLKICVIMSQKDCGILRGMVCKSPTRQRIQGWQRNLTGNLHKIKKGMFSFSELNVYPKLNLVRHLIYAKIKCHFFITTIIMIRRNKMIAMSLRTFKIKVLVFIFIKSPLYKRFGRHSTTDYSLWKLY